MLIDHSVSTLICLNSSQVLCKEVSFPEMFGERFIYMM